MRKDLTCRRLPLSWGILILGMLAVISRAAFGAECVIDVTVDYLDPENDIVLDLYMEPLEKYLAQPPESATDPARIRADAANTALPPLERTLVLRTGINLESPDGIRSLAIPCADIPDSAAVLFDTPYVILGVYTDNVIVSGSTPRLFGAVSPGTFMFSVGDIKISLTVDSQEVPPPSGQDSSEKLDITWSASSFLPGSSVTLFFDRDNRLDIVSTDGTYLRTIVATDVDNASNVLTTTERIRNNGTFGLDYGPINLTVDGRFPPPPSTGKINPTQYPTGTFRWDFSDFPAGQLFVYGVLNNTDGNRVVDYAPGSSVATEARWPVFIGDAVDDRFVHGVAIHDIVASASELDVVAVAQSGLFRVLDYLGRTWGSYSIDLDVTIDTAPAPADVDNDGEVEIILGTNQLNSDENPIFAHRNAVLMIDAQFKGRYEALLNAVRGFNNPSQAQIEGLVSAYNLTNAIYFLPDNPAISTDNHRGVYHTPAIRDLDGDGIKEVVVVTRPDNPNTTSGITAIEVLNFNLNTGIPPLLKASIQSPSGNGYLGGPSLGNLLGGKERLEACVGSAAGQIFVFDPLSGSLGTPVLTVPGPTLRSPALIDTDGDGIEEILMAISERDRVNPARTELHFLKSSGAPVPPFSSTRIYRPVLAYDSLSTPVVSRMYPSGSVPVGFQNDLVAMFTTRNTFTGINLQQLDPITGQPAIVFNFAPTGVDYFFGSSSPVVGQFDPSQNSYEIILGGGRDAHGDLFGWSFSSLTNFSGNLTPANGFVGHQEPKLEGQFYPSSILGSPEIADLDGNGRTDVIYTNEGGFINRLESPGVFPSRFLPSDFPWPAFKHDSARTGSASSVVAPIVPFLPGDINRDGVVDENDLFFASQSWGQSVPISLRRSALGQKPTADDVAMNPPRYLLRVLSDMRR